MTAAGAGEDPPAVAVVLGGLGMLGHALVDALADAPGVRVRATVRTAADLAPARAWRPDVEWAALDAAGAEPEVAAGLTTLLAGAGWAFNAAGMIKQRLRDDRREDVERAVRVNALFPALLARAAGEAGARVVQIATDCVYGGARGGYAEGAPHDALDVYGKTKSLGEVAAPGVHNLRCSIVGPERRGHRSLLEWLRRQPPGATLEGWVDHRWNGVTTRAFARLCRGLVERGPALPARAHWLPADAVTKHELLTLFARALGRHDLKVLPRPSPAPVDRTLATDDPALSARLWTLAGYPGPPTIAALVEEVAATAAHASAAEVEA